MPTVNFKKTFGLVASIFLMGTLIYSGVRYFSTRSLSSALKPSPPQSIFTSKGVSARLLSVLLEAEKVQNDNESVEVIARIKMPFDFPHDLNFKWQLGEGVTLVEGAAVGVIHEMRADQEVEIKIKVKGFSLSQNHHIGFDINGSSNGRNIHGDSLIASDIENTFENTVQNVEQIKASQ